MSAIDHALAASETTDQPQSLLESQDIADKPGMPGSETMTTMVTPWQPSDLVSALLSQSARDVVRHWISQKPFLGDDNQPRSLYPDNSDGIDFNNLVKRVSPHLVPAVIRNELLRKGVVELHDNDCLLLRRIAFVVGAPSVEDRYLYS